MSLTNVSAAGAYCISSFSNMKGLVVCLLPPGWKASLLPGLSPSIKFAGTHSYTSVQCHPQEHNTVTVPIQGSNLDHLIHEATLPSKLRPF